MTRRSIATVLGPPLVGLLIMVGTATTVPVDANVSAPAREPYQQTTTWSVNF